MPASDTTYTLRVRGSLVLETDDFLELCKRHENALTEYSHDDVKARRDGEPFRPGPSRLVERFSFEVPR